MENTNDYLDKKIEQLNWQINYHKERLDNVEVDAEYHRNKMKEIGFELSVFEGQLAQKHNDTEGK